MYLLTTCRLLKMKALCSYEVLWYRTISWKNRIRSVLFWDFTWCRMVVLYRLCRTTCWSHLKWSESQKKSAQISSTPWQKPEITQGTESLNCTSLKGSLTWFQYYLIFFLLHPFPCFISIIFGINTFLLSLLLAFSVSFVIQISLSLLYRTLNFGSL
jgi:hypothetical protein